MKKKLIILGGATAVGKTKLSVKLAKKFKSQIISADSRQFYKELNIGVAKPSKLEIKKVIHHFIGHISIEQSYSVGEYEEDGLKLINRLFKKHNILFLCGGSGLYIDAICEGLNTFPKINKKIKEKINSDLKQKGLDFLNEELKSIDLKTYKKIDKQNSRRVIRALEVYRSSGVPYSFYIKKEKKVRDFKTLFITLTKSRKNLYENINDRVDQMITAGLINEAKKLYRHKHTQGLNTIGYQEIFKYLDKKISLERAINEIKKNTRRYAKRQINWFNKKKYHQFDVDGEEDIIEFIKNQNK